MASDIEKYVKACNRFMPSYNYIENWYTKKKKNNNIKN